MGKGHPRRVAQVGFQERDRRRVTQMGVQRRDRRRVTRTGLKQRDHRGVAQVGLKQRNHRDQDPRRTRTRQREEALGYVRRLPVEDILNVQSP